MNDVVNCALTVIVHVTFVSVLGFAVDPSLHCENVYDGFGKTCTGVPLAPEVTVCTTLADEAPENVPSLVFIV